MTPASGTDGTPAEGWGGAPGTQTGGHLPPVLSKVFPLAPCCLLHMLFVISSLWKNHKLLRECYTIAWVGGPGPQARGTRGSRVNDLGVKGSISILDFHTHSESSQPSLSFEEREVPVL